MSTSPKSDRQQTAHESVEFPATVAEGNAGEIGRLLIVRLSEHRHTPKQRLLEYRNWPNMLTETIIG